MTSPCSPRSPGRSLAIAAVALTHQQRGARRRPCGSAPATRAFVGRMKAGEDSDLRYERLRDASVTGVRWSLIARVIGESGTLVASIVLARLVGPAEFGHAAI